MRGEPIAYFISNIKPFTCLSGYFIKAVKTFQNIQAFFFKVNDTVTVEMSPFDMSQGRVVVFPALSDEVDHEGKKFSQENV